MLSYKHLIMYFVDLFKKNKVALITLSLVVLIILLLGTLYYLSSSEGIFLKNSNTAGSDLKNYTILKAKINSITSDTYLGNQPLFSKIISKLNIVENKQNSEEKRYQGISDAAFYLQAFYSSTNNPKLYPLISSFDIFAKENFPKYYEKRDFVYYCQDQTCAESPQPQEIKNIIEEIKASDFPEEVKQSTVRSLLNVGYLSKKDSETKFYKYLLIAQIVRGYSDFTKTGVNTKIADTIYNYAISAFPENYKELLKSPRATQSGLIQIQK